MSSEVAKKRGRPKKVISDPIEIDLPEIQKSVATRAKSTKAAPKAAKANPAVTKKAAGSPTPPKLASIPPSPAVKTALKSPVPIHTSNPESIPPKLAPSQPTSNYPLKPETSKILDEVRKLSAKSLPAPPDPLTSSKPSPSTIPHGTSAQSLTSTPPKPTRTSTNIPPLSAQPTPSKPSQASPAPSKPPPKIPIAALNSEIVSSISSRAGARPKAGSSGQLPPNYKPVARKVTMAIVAMPILIVTSYVLYERLVLGEERKLLVQPGPSETTKTEE